jgi:hypothetical protein
MGDSLLWRFIRYAAKDWEAVPPSPILSVRARKPPGNAFASGSLGITFADPARNAVTVSDLTGRQVFARTYTGEIRAEIPNLQRGIYYVRVSSRTRQEVRKVGVF